MNFSCGYCPSVSSMMKNDEILMNFDQFVDIYSKLGVRRRSDGKISDFDRKQVDSLVELPVGWV